MEELVKNKKNGMRKIIFLLIVVVLIIGSKTYYDRQFLAVNKTNPEEISVEIPEGSSSSKISDILFQQGLIKNKSIFKIAIRNKESGNKLKAGNYALNTGMDVYDIIDELTKGSKNENVARFTIPEGYEIRQMADRLSEQELVNKDRF